MGLMQKDVKATRRHKGARTYQDNSASDAGPQAIVGASSTLTFVTSDGESIVFDGMDVPIEEATALMGEEALGKIWNRPAEEAAWHDI